MGQIRLSKQVAMEGDDYRSCHQCSIVGLHLPAQAPSATAGIKGKGKGKVTGTIAHGTVQGRKAVEANRIRSTMGGRREARSRGWGEPARTQWQSHDAAQNRGTALGQHKIGGDARGWRCPATKAKRAHHNGRFMWHDNVSTDQGGR